VQLVVAVDAEDALTAAQRALAVTGRALRDTGLAAPVTSSPSRPKPYPTPQAANPGNHTSPRQQPGPSHRHLSAG